MLYDYPNKLNTEAVYAIANYFRGKEPIYYAAHAAWELQGYGMSLGLPAPQTLGSLPEGEYAAQLFESIVEGPDKAKAINWALLLIMLAKIIADFWTKRT